MANPSDLTVRVTDRNTAGVQGDVDTIRAEFNKLVTNLRVLTGKLDVLTAKLNADAGVTDTNYAIDFATTVTDSAASGPAKVTAVFP